MKTSLLPTLLIIASIVSFPRLADACGGGVSEPAAPVSIGGQRAYLSVRADGSTDVVVQLDVAEASGDYGVLLPLPVEPVVDDQPISVEAFDALDTQTRPYIEGAFDVADTGGGCACGGAGEAGGVDGGGERGSVTIGSFTEIGPVTATALTADDTAALLTWLTDNGFEIPSEHQPLVDSYVGAGSWFLAFKRSDAAPSGKSSVGVHFNVPEDCRDYPLAISRMGAAPEIAVTVWVAHSDGVSPLAPFTVVPSGELQGVEDDASYAEAVRAAAAETGGKTFVVEYLQDNPGNLPSAFAAFTDDGATITRMSTIIKREEIDQDVSFTGPPPPHPETGLASLLPRRLRPFGLLLVLGLGAALVIRRGTRSRSSIATC